MATPLTQAPAETAAQETAAAEPAAESLGALRRIFGALGNNPHYRLVLVRQPGQHPGQQMQMVANGYLAYTLTGSATALGVVAFASSVPMLLFAPARRRAGRPDAEAQAAAV